MEKEIKNDHNAVRLSKLCPAQSSVPLRISLEPSSDLPPTNIECHSTTQLNAGDALDSDTAIEGIGILNFLQGKSYFITGATGLLAKAFVEKILRVAPSTRKIFLLMKAKDEEEAIHRVKIEIVECELFKRLKELHGENYRDFMMSKLVPVVGNMCEPKLGISNAGLATLMAEEVDVIVNSAANTTFDERYDVAVNLNTQGPLRLLSFAKKFKKLRIFLHVSTAYVNGERQGVVKEKPFYMGQSIAEEMAIATGSVQPFPLPKLDVHTEIELASQTVKSFPKEGDIDHKMKELGMVRARMFGWQDTYEFTKAMGEMMISSYKGHIPVAIIRPSIIESTYAEPVPGWIQGIRMADPLLLSYAKGQLPGYLTDPNIPIDIVPVDMVVNTMVSAMAKHGTSPDPEFNVYQVSSSVINPLMVHEIWEFTYHHFASFPLRDSKGEKITIERMKFFSSLAEFSDYIQHEVAKRMVLRDRGVASNPRTFYKLREKCKRTVESLIHRAKIYEPYAFYKGRFHNENTQRLVAEMSSEELKTFPLDLRSVDWKDYIVNIHLPGLRRYVLEDGESVVDKMISKL